MKKLALVFCLSIVHFGSCNNVPTYRSYKDYKCLKVQGSRSGIEQLKIALQDKDESLSYSDTRDGTEFVVAPNLEKFFAEKLAEDNLTATVLFDDISKVIQLEKSMLRGGDEFSWNAYYDIDDIYRFLTNTSKTYSKWSELIVGGQSYQGRSILGLRINTGQWAKPVIFIESGIHAREWIAPATTTYLINELLTNTDPKIQGLRDQFDWRIFPSVNPDGYHYSYTVQVFTLISSLASGLTISVADTSHHRHCCPPLVYWISSGIFRDGYPAIYPKRWYFLGFSLPTSYESREESRIACGERLFRDLAIDALARTPTGIGITIGDTYAGSRPFSEIETRTLSEYIQGIDNLVAYVSFHSYAAMLLIPYSDSTQHVDNYEDLVKVGKTSLDYGYKVNKGKRYQGPGTAAEMLYKASGGSIDWVRHALGTPLAYTYELRGNSFHWPPSRIQEQGDEVTQMMLGLATEARNLGYF